MGREFYCMYFEIGWFKGQTKNKKRFLQLCFSKCEGRRLMFRITRPSLEVTVYTNHSCEKKEQLSVVKTVKCCSV